MLTVSRVESQVKLQLRKLMVIDETNCCPLFSWPSQRPLSARQSDHVPFENVHCTSLGSFEHVFSSFWRLDTCRVYCQVEVEDHQHVHGYGGDSGDARRDCPSGKMRAISEGEKKQVLLSSSFWQMSLSRLRQAHTIVCLCER